MAQQFQVDLRAVVDLLARHVYSSPRVYVRELLQNAVDAVTARRSLDPDWAPPPIRIVPSDASDADRDPDGRDVLRISDPGIGLTVTEVHELLATIGGSSKRDALDLPRDGFLGRFGIGLLSCFVVASRIEVLTRSATGAGPVRFVGHADGTYEVSELSDDDPEAPETGTVVRLVARPGSTSWLAYETVVALARTYGSALAETVEVAGPEGRFDGITETEVPWLDGTTGSGADRRFGQIAWCERHFGFTPMAVIGLQSRSVGAEGVAFVLPTASHSGIHPGHRTYLRRMLLGDDIRTVLPDWGFFVRAVLDVGELHPTASREALVDDDALELARDELGRCLRDWLVRLGTTDPRQMEQFLGVHGLAAKALAVHDDEVHRQLAPWLPYETSAGTLTVPEIVRRAGIIRYTPTVDRFRQLSGIGSAQGLVVVNAGYAYDRELLDRAETVVPGATAVPLDDDDIVSTLDAVSAEREAWAEPFLTAASDALDEVGCDVELRGFDPEVVPVLLLHDDEARARRRRRQTASEVDDDWAGLLEALDDGRSDRPLLVCNDRHVLVRRLVDRARTGSPVVASAVHALYGQALLLGHHPLRSNDLALLNHALLDLVEGALDH